MRNVTKSVQQVKADAQDVTRPVTKSAQNETLVEFNERNGQYNPNNESDELISFV